MLPSTRTPPLSPSSLSSSDNHDRRSPPTPDSFSPVTPDEFDLQLDLQLEKMVASLHKPSIIHLPPQPPLPSDPYSTSGDDMSSKAQVILRNRGRWENMYESSPLHSHNVPPPSLPQDSADDDFSWEAAHSAIVELDELSDPSRCSLLIHEVSLLVGLTADEDHYTPPDDARPLVPGASKQVHDILPLTLNPTKSLASGKHRNAGLPHPTISSYPSIPPSIIPRNDSAGQSLYNQRSPPPLSRDLATPIPRHKRADVSRPNLSPRWRQGQVFHVDPLPSNAPHQRAVDLDKTFCCPRDPPPKPTSNPAANRCSSLDRLECSLLKLQAHAPGNHRKSHSEGPPSVHAVHVTERKDKRPSLPPPRRLKERQSSHQIMHRHHLRPHDPQFQNPPPVPKSVHPRQYAVLRTCPPVALDNDFFEEDPTPGSFMDMDIPHAEEALQERRNSFRRVNSKRKMKSFVDIAKRVSRGVIVWGKHLTGSRKLPVTAQETTTVAPVSSIISSLV